MAVAPNDRTAAACGVGHVEVLGDLMANPNPAQEPSMEEILASIRRIISDEDTTAAEPSESASAPSGETGGADQMDVAGEAMSQDDLDKLFDSDGDTAVEEPEPASAEPEEEDILELTEEQAVSEEPSTSEEDEDDKAAASGADEADDDEIAFIDSDEAEDDAVDAADFSEPAKNDIAAAVRAGAAEEVERLVSPSVDTAVNSAFNNLANTVLMNNARTLEDLVKDMLRPMLKAWLDQNLPPLVERLVRQEIERVSRGR